MSFRGLTFEKSLKAFPTPRSVAQEPLPDALRMADTLERMSLSTRWDKEAAAELRRLHQSEREGWRHADELEQERQRLRALNLELLEALKELVVAADRVSAEPATWLGKARAAIAKATGGAK